MSELADFISKYLGRGRDEDDAPMAAPKPQSATPLLDSVLGAGFFGHKDQQASDMTNQWRHNQEGSNAAAEQWAQNEVAPQGKAMPWSYRDQGMPEQTMPNTMHPSNQNRQYRQLQTAYEQPWKYLNRDPMSGLDVNYSLDYQDGIPVKDKNINNIDNSEIYSRLSPSEALDSNKVVYDSVINKIQDFKRNPNDYRYDEDSKRLMERLTTEEPMRYNMMEVADAFKNKKEWDEKNAPPSVFNILSRWLGKQDQRYEMNSSGYNEGIYRGLRNLGAENVPYNYSRLATAAKWNRYRNGKRPNEESFTDYMSDISNYTKDQEDYNKADIWRGSVIDSIRETGKETLDRQLVNDIKNISDYQNDDNIRNMMKENNIDAYDAIKKYKDDELNDFSLEYFKSIPDDIFYNWMRDQSPPSYLREISDELYKGIKRESINERFRKRK